MATKKKATKKTVKTIIDEKVKPQKTTSSPKKETKETKNKSDETIAEAKTSFEKIIESIQTPPVEIKKPKKSITIIEPMKPQVMQMETENPKPIVINQPNQKNKPNQPQIILKGNKGVSDSEKEQMQAEMQKITNQMWTSVDKNHGFVPSHVFQDAIKNSKSPFTIKTICEGCTVKITVINSNGFSMESEAFKMI